MLLLERIAWILGERGVRINALASAPFAAEAQGGASQLGPVDELGYDQIIAQAQQRLLQASTPEAIAVEQWHPAATPLLQLVQACDLQPQLLVQKILQQKKPNLKEILRTDYKF